MAAPIKPPAAVTDAELKRAVAIREGAIQEEYVQFPSTFYRWLSERSACARVLRLAELELEVVEARVKARHRKARLDEIEAAGKEAKIKPLTEDQTSDAMVLDPEYQAARKHVVEVNELKDKAQAMVQALEAKKDMLVSLGADLRGQYESDPSIRDRRPR